MLGTRRNEGHLVALCEAENGTPLGEPSPSAQGQRPWPQLPGDAGHPSTNSWFSQQPRLLSQGLPHCPHAPLHPGSRAEPCCRHGPAFLLGSWAAPPSLGAQHCCPTHHIVVSASASWSLTPRLASLPVSTAHHHHSGGTRKVSKAACDTDPAAGLACPTTVSSKRRPKEAETYACAPPSPRYKCMENARM